MSVLGSLRGLFGRRAEASPSPQHQDKPDLYAALASGPSLSPDASRPGLGQEPLFWGASEPLLHHSHARKRRRPF
jgi:hypothetical protein